MDCLSAASDKQQPFLILCTMLTGRIPLGHIRIDFVTRKDYFVNITNACVMFVYVCMENWRKKYANDFHFFLNTLLTQRETKMLISHTLEC